MPSSRVSSHPRDQTQSPALQADSLPSEPRGACPAADPTIAPRGGHYCPHWTEALTWAQRGAVTFRGFRVTGGAGYRLRLMWSRASLSSTPGKASSEGLTSGLVVHHGHLQASQLGHQCCLAHATLPRHEDLVAGSVNGHRRGEHWSLKQPCGKVGARWGRGPTWGSFGANQPFSIQYP